MKLSQILREYSIINGRLFAQLFGGLTIRAAQRSLATTVVYAASVVIDATAGNYFTVTVTDANAYAIAAPTNPPATSFAQLLVLTIRNASGGAAGTGTWNAAFKVTGNVPAIANGFSRSFAFVWNGTVWVEIFATAADIPN